MILSSSEAQEGRAVQRKQSVDGPAGSLPSALCSVAYLLCAFRQVTHPLWASSVI